jgi:hypothetical protein
MRHMALMCQMMRARPSRRTSVSVHVPAKSCAHRFVQIRRDQTVQQPGGRPTAPAPQRACACSQPPPLTSFIPLCPTFDDDFAAPAKLCFVSGQRAPEWDIDRSEAVAEAGEHKAVFDRGGDGGARARARSLAPRARARSLAPGTEAPRRSHRAATRALPATRQPWAQAPPASMKRRQQPQRRSPRS